MEKKKKIIITIAVLVALAVVGVASDDPSNGRKVGFGPGEQDWNWVEVREGAHIFWWLYFTTANVTEYTDRPLAIWLQGGPGSSSSGYGNFEEFGPLDVEGNERNFTWVKDMNVLFIDSPVGTGFSYVDDFQHLTTTNAQIADDLVASLIGFYEVHPEFRTVPLHIFSESYGGKVAMEFAYVLHQAIEENRIECDLKSVVSVDGWISPLDSMYSWAPFLLYMGFVDDHGYEEIMNATRYTEMAFNNGEYVASTDLWGHTEGVIIEQTHDIDFYNVLRAQGYRGTNGLKNLLSTITPRELMYRTLVERNLHIDITRQRVDPLTVLMRGPVSEALNIPENIVFGSQSSIVFSTLAGDFMKPDILMVENLLNETSIEVVIITGQLDLIVATPGTVEWVKKVRWPGADLYKASERHVLPVNNIIEGYYKRHENFVMYWINRAGHMVPFDNPQAMDYILRSVTKYHES